MHRETRAATHGGGGGDERREHDWCVVDKPPRHALKVDPPETHLEWSSGSEEEPASAHAYRVEHVPVANGASGGAPPEAPRDARRVAEQAHSTGGGQLNTAKGDVEDARLVDAHRHRRPHVGAATPPERALKERHVIDAHLGELKKNPVSP